MIAVSEHDVPIRAKRSDRYPGGLEGRGSRGRQSGPNGRRGYAGGAAFLGLHLICVAVRV
jgi:hypothetical protein